MYRSDGARELPPKVVVVPPWVVLRQPHLYVGIGSMVRLDAFGCDRTSAIVNGANEKTLIGRSAPLKLLFLVERGVPKDYLRWYF